MNATRTRYARLLAAGITTLLAAWPGRVHAQDGIGPTDIGGAVTSAKGPEAGVWVIAETTGLGTSRYAKIVVTDDQGRYLLPALPSGAQYNVWVRGFGLVDSPRVRANPGGNNFLRSLHLSGGPNHRPSDNDLGACRSNRQHRHRA